MNVQDPCVTQPLETMSFEQTLAELESILRSLESGTTSLEASITAYERGITLQKRCEAMLAQARARIEVITMAPNNTASTHPFETQKEG